MTLPYCKWYPEAWIDGTRKLSPEERGIYADLLNFMYRRNGPLEDDERDLAYLLHVDRRVWKRIRRQLIEKGKIEVADGYITQNRAATELELRASYVATKAENRAGSSKNSDLENRPSTDKDRQTKTEKKTVSVSEPTTTRQTDNPPVSAREVSCPVLSDVDLSPFAAHCIARIPEDMRGSKKFVENSKGVPDRLLAEGYSREQIEQGITDIIAQQRKRGEKINGLGLVASCVRESAKQAAQTGVLEFPKNEAVWELVWPDDMPAAETNGGNWIGKRNAETGEFIARKNQPCAMTG